MRKLILITAVAIGLTHCSNEPLNDKNILLTSTRWTTTQDDDHAKALRGIWSFKADGTYVEDFNQEGNVDKIILVGQWKWESDDELSLFYNSMSINGKKYELGNDESDRYVIRITDLTKTEWRGIKRFNGDAEDSGFAKNIAFVSADN